MEVYVDKLPKDCHECKLKMIVSCNLTGECVIENMYKRTLNDNCPLKLISEAKKQERERVIDLIDNEIDNNCYFVETEEEYCAVKTRPIKEFMRKLKQEDTSK